MSLINNSGLWGGTPGLWDGAQGLQGPDYGGGPVPLTPLAISDFKTGQYVLDGETASFGDLWIAGPGGFDPEVGLLPDVGLIVGDLQLTAITTATPVTLVVEYTLPADGDFAGDWVFRQYFPDGGGIDYPPASGGGGSQFYGYWFALNALGSTETVPATTLRLALTINGTDVAASYMGGDVISDTAQIGTGDNFYDFRVLSYAPYTDYVCVEKVTVYPAQSNSALPGLSA